MALEPGRTSWTAPLDTVRLNPNDDLTTVTAGQVRDVVRRLAEAGHHQNGAPDVLVVFDAGYDATRLAYLLADLPVELVDRLHSDRVFHLPAPPWQPGTTGRPRRHGPDFKFSDETTWAAPDVSTTTETTRYGTAVATS
nr:transposase [Candidatus Frankia alpina]